MADPSKYPKKEIDRFDDVFHKLNDDVDEDQDKYVDFDNLYQSFHQDIDVDDDILASLMQHDEEENNPTRTDVVTEEQHLSQRLSQLAASVQEPEEVELGQGSTTMKKKRPSLTPTTPTSEAASKKIKTTTTTTTVDTNEKEDADLPRFLSRTNDIFQDVTKPLLDKAPSSINIEHLRKIALLKFDIAVNDLQISLWTAYLRSGTGKILESEQQPQATTTAATSTTSSHLKRWPSDVKRKILESGDITINRHNISGDTCLNYVSKMLHQYRDKKTHCYNELKQLKQRLTNSYTLEMEEIIDQFVEQYGIAFHRVPINGQIATVEFQYKDRLLELEFYEQSPNVYHIEVFKNICDRKYEKETTKMMVAILKQRLTYNHLPSSFESLRIPEPMTFNTIQNNTIRQRLQERYNKVVQRTKSDMLTVYIAAEQAKADERVVEFDREYGEMKENLRCGPTHKKLTPTMLGLLQKRLRNMNEHIMYLYNLKMDFFAKAPTDKN